MIFDADISVTDKTEAVRIGESNEIDVITRYLEIKRMQYPDWILRAHKFGQFGSLDYVVSDDEKIRCFVEAKIRKEKKYSHTMIGSAKEASAINLHKQFGYSEKVFCYFLVYFQDTKELFQIDLVQPPEYRQWKERHDRKASDLYSFYPLTNCIYRGNL